MNAFTWIHFASIWNPLLWLVKSKPQNMATETGKTYVSFTFQPTFCLQLFKISLSNFPQTRSRLSQTDFSFFPINLLLALVRNILIQGCWNMCSSEVGGAKQHCHGNKKHRRETERQIHEQNGKPRHKKKKKIWGKQFKGKKRFEEQKTPNPRKCQHGTQE